MNNKVSTLFFSPTKTTKSIVKTIAKKLSAHYSEYNLTLPKQRQLNKELTFDSDDLILVGVPIYKGRIPQFIAKQFAAYRGNNTKAIFTVTYGNRDYDDALLELKNLFEERGFIGVAAGAFIGEHSYTNEVATNRPDTTDLAIATQFAQKVKALLIKRPNIAKQHLRVKGNMPYKKSQEGPIMLPETNKRCTDCAICANTCPMGAIDYTNYRDIDPDKCIQCCNCVKICPENAKEFTSPLFATFREKLKNELAVGRKEPELFFVEH